MKREDTYLCPPGAINHLKTPSLIAEIKLIKGVISPK
jgi:hypothetical protein